MGRKQDQDVKSERLAKQLRVNLARRKTQRILRKEIDKNILSLDEVSGPEDLGVLTQCLRDKKD